MSQQIEATHVLFLPVMCDNIRIILWVMVARARTLKSTFEATRKMKNIICLIPL